jgi:putative two-component system response regulator
MSGQLFPSEPQICAAKILIIDDEDADIRVLEWAFQTAQFPNFRSVTDSTKALDVFKQFQPDIVLLDLNMPEPDGFTVLKQLRATAPVEDFLPVLVLTGQNTTETRRQAMAAGANDFLGKPVDYTEVMLRIRNLLQTRFLHQQARGMQKQLEALPAARETDIPTNPGQKP